MTDTSPSMLRQWLRHFKLFFLVGLLLFCIQLLLAYLLPIQGTNGDINDGSSGSVYDNLLEERKARQNKAVFNELFAAERPSMDDEYISNSNSIYNFKDPLVLSKTSSSAKDHSNGKNLLNSKNRQQYADGGGGGGGGAGVHLQLDDLKFKPICDIVTKETISAIYRAQTQRCKEIIANISCAIQMAQFYPTHLPNYCPHDSLVANRPLGCYQDDKKFRLLSGYYVNFKANNTPAKCIQMCLQSGFVYAGVQYS